MSFYFLSISLCFALLFLSLSLLSFDQQTEREPQLAGPSLTHGMLMPTDPSQKRILSESLFILCRAREGETRFFSLRSDPRWRKGFVVFLPKTEGTLFPEGSAQRVQTFYKYEMLSAPIYVDIRAHRERAFRSLVNRLLLFRPVGTTALLEERRRIASARSRGAACEATTSN